MKTKYTCKNVYQDKTYGKSIRIANTTDKLNIVRCTSWGKDIITIKTVKKVKTKKSKKK